MMTTRYIGAMVLVVSTMAGMAQSRKGLPPVTTTFKGTLVLPVPLGNPLFADITETIGQLDGALTFHIRNGLGVGAGAKMTWFGIEERALAPLVTTGEIRKSTYFGKLSYERYTGERTFYELFGRAGMSNYVFDCPTCASDARVGAFHWGAGVAYYLHATDNLAFGLMLGYETDATTFEAGDLGLETFPGRVETAEARPFQNVIFGMGFSTRFKRSEDQGW
ncbi:MAG: hypothetical protein KDC03_13145 [Flavobacteriales bacterium]|nr:hypothetical protein [Flavobacteriales bacterium]